MSHRSWTVRFPGVDETMALLRLAELVTDDRWQRVVIDTAPTGHTLRLLDLPRSFTLLLSLLDAMQDKHRFMVRTLMHRYRTDDADAFLASMRARVASLTRLLGDRARCAAVLVTREEPVVLAETRAIRACAGGARHRRGRSDRQRDDDDEHRSRECAAELVAELRSATPGAAWSRVARGAVALGLDGAREWGARLSDDVARLARCTRTDAASASRSARLRTRARRRAASALLSPLSALTIVGGKGGVGKTTVACALALAAAEPTVRSARAPRVHRSRAVARGRARRSRSATRRWTWRAYPDSSHGRPTRAPPSSACAPATPSASTRCSTPSSAHAIDTSADRRIVRDLLALAPPGIDELYALAAIADAVGEQRFARVIVDPAPTGHLLRLLEMPAIALDWTHQLMRLVLRYRELGALGDAGADLLSLAKRIRAVGELLRDPARASLIVVALDEPLVRPRDAAPHRRRGRAGRPDQRRDLESHRAGAPLPQLPLPAATTAAQLVAFETQPSPRGIDAIRQWADTWRAASDVDTMTPHCRAHVGSRITFLVPSRLASMTVPPLLYAYAIVSLPEERELVTNHLHRMVGIDAAPVTLVSDSADVRPQPTAVLVSAGRRCDLRAGAGGVARRRSWSGSRRARRRTIAW